MKNETLRKSFNNRRCLVCNRRGCDPCHIKTYGSGGVDEEWNLMPLCRQHHSEQHNLGLFSFINKYPSVKFYINSHGWYFDEQSGVPKLLRDNIT